MRNSEYGKLVRKKALQNLSPKKKDIWDILIQNPEKEFSILTVENLVRERNAAKLSHYFTSGYALAMFNDNDLRYISICMGLSNIQELRNLAREHDAFTSFILSLNRTEKNPSN